MKLIIPNVAVADLFRSIFVRFVRVLFLKLCLSESPNHDIQRTFSLGAFYTRKRNKRDVLRTVIANKLFVKAVIFPGELRDFLA